MNKALVLALAASLTGSVAYAQKIECRDAHRTVTRVYLNAEPENRDMAVGEIYQLGRMGELYVTDSVTRAVDAYAIRGAGWGDGATHAFVLKLQTTLVEGKIQVGVGRLVEKSGKDVLDSISLRCRLR